MELNFGWPKKKPSTKDEAKSLVCNFPSRHHRRDKSIFEIDVDFQSTFEPHPIHIHYYYSSTCYSKSIYFFPKSNTRLNIFKFMRLILRPNVLKSFSHLSEKNSQKISSRVENAFTLVESCVELEKTTFRKSALVPLLVPSPVH